MPVQCSTNVLTGADGLVTMSPPGTSVCLAEADVTAAGIDVGKDKKFQVGDPVTIEYPTGATKEDSTLAEGDYFVQAFDKATGIMQVSATKGGAKIAPTADGDWDDQGHVELYYTGTEAICQVVEWSLDLTKQTTDTTTLPCSVSAASTIAPVRSQQGTFLEGQGSMTILFTADQASAANRLLAGSISMDSTVYAKLYLNAVPDSTGIDDTNSLYYAGKVNLLGFSVTVNTTDAVQAEVTFSPAEQPDTIFGQS